MSRPPGLGAIVLSLLVAGCASVPPVPAPAGAPASRAEAMAEYALGVQKDLRGTGDAAISNYLRAVELDPQNEEIHYRVVTDLLQRRRFDEAEQVISSLCARKPAAPKPQLWRALVYRTAGKADQAEAVYRSLLEQHPGFEQGYLELAGLLVKGNQAEKAVAVLEEALDRNEEALDALKVAAELTLRRVSIGTEPRDSARVKRLADRLAVAADRRPDDEDLMLAVADFDLVRGEPSRALERYSRVEARRPDDAALKQKIAAALAELGDRPKAVAALENAVKAQPDNPQPYLYLAQLHEQAGDAAAAAKALQAAVDRGIKSPAPFLRLALLRLKDSPEEAVSVLRRGMERLPREPALAEMLAYVLSNADRETEAVPVYEKARELLRERGAEPMSPLFGISHARALQRAGETDRAAARLEEAAAEQPEAVNAYVDLALRDDDPVRRTGAIKVLESLARRSPDLTPLTLVGRALLHSAAEDYATAAGLFEQAEKALEDSPADAETLGPGFYFWFGSACERNGDYARAEALLRICLEKAPDYAEAYNYLAYTWAERGTNLEEALKFSRKSLELEPDNPAFLDTLGWIYYAQGKYEDALREVGRAANLMPDDATLADHLGDIMDKLGKRDRALTYWKRSYVLDPDQTKVEEKLKKNGVDLAPLQAEAKKLADEKKRAGPIPGPDDE